MGDIKSGEASSQESSRTIGFGWQWFLQYLPIFNGILETGVMEVFFHHGNSGIMTSFHGGSSCTFHDAS